MSRCSGCGSVLQTANKSKIGYIVESALQMENPLCMRCFNIKNYCKNVAKDYTDEQFISILNNIPSDSLVVMIVDVFDLNSTLLPDIIDIVKEYDVLLFVNKADMLIDDINIDKLLSNIVSMYINLGLKIINGALISAKYNFNIDYAKELIDKYNQGRDIYIVGVSNVGKSQFISAFLKECNTPNDNITISHFPATTIDVLKFNYSNLSVYDTPGVINRSQVIHYIDENDIKFLYPKKLKSFVYQLKEDSTIFIGGLVQIDIVKTKSLALTIFCSSLINVHRRKTEGSLEFRKNHKDDILLLNYTQENLVTRQFELKKNDEIVVNGLCWFKVNNDVCLNVTLHQDVGISVRKKLV